ncbi:hypothetical protein BOX15_Mlig026429g2 [Macrostomum lignano]|uniref:Ionotropic glutamate receptor C-terminal domain-containing protein n=1 Tax=Macrostomum lignano TaxID=282301 RepID=A0A267H166_9PLAT|nr:hypothetical protein BOX15_Mlig026429g2 [Macrostomum lignano]
MSQPNPGFLRSLFATILLLTIAASAAKSQTIKIGVHNDVKILNSLTSLNSSEVARLFNITFINVSSFHLGPDPETLVQVRSYLESVRSNPPHLIIGGYNGTVSAIASELGIPYYCTSPSHQSPLLMDATYLNASSLLLMNSYMEDMIAAAQQLTNSIIQRQALIVVTDDISDSVNFLLNSLSDQALHMVLLNGSIRDSLYNASLKFNISSAVFQTMFTSDLMLEALLPEAARLSLMKNVSFWIITDLFPNSSQLLAYRRTGCTMFSFALQSAASNVTSPDALTLAMAQDAINHYLKVVDGGRLSFDLSRALLTSYNGILGQLHFSSGTRRNLYSQLNTMMTSYRLPYLEEFGVWAKNNSGGIALIRGGLRSKLPILRVLTFMRQPFTMASPTEYYGFSISVLNHLSAGLFEWDVVPVAENGDLLPLLRQGAGDLIANPMQMPLDNSKNDSNVSYSSWPLMYTSVSAMGYAESPKLSFLSPLFPFSWNVWLAVVVAFVILSATLYSIDKISPNDYRRPKFSISESVFFVYSSFMMSKLSAKAIKPSSRIFILILWFASLMYCTTYGTNAFFLLIRSNRALPFTSLDGLYNQSGRYYRVLVENSTSSGILAAQPEGSVYRKLATADLWVESEEAALALIKNQTALPDGRQPVYVGDGAAISYAVAKSCDLMMAGSNELYRPLFLAMRAGLDPQLRRTINDRIQSMSDRGLLDQYKDTYWSEIKCSSNDYLINAKELNSIHIEQVSGIFIVLACALGLSFIVLLLEHAFYQLQLYWHRMKVNSRLEFMKPYQAEVTNVTPSGIRVRVQGWVEFLPNQMLSPDPTKKMTAADLEIRIGDSVEVVYLGNDPKTGERLFRRNAESVEVGKIGI